MADDREALNSPSLFKIEFIVKIYLLETRIWSSEHESYKGLLKENCCGCLTGISIRGMIVVLDL